MRARDGLGAYGLVIDGLAGARSWMQRQRPDAPELTVAATATASADRSAHRLDQRSASIRLVGDGRLDLHRDERVARFSFPAVPPDSDLLHPHLASAAALVWQWSGREALHGGAVRIAGGAVLILGDKEAGKSSTLAWLARERGADVLTDDLAVITEGGVHPGPRCIDLRPPQGDQHPRVRGGERARVRLATAPDPLPIVGTAVLGWGTDVSLVSVPPPERLRLLARQRYYPPLAEDSTMLLELVSRPMVELRRPPDLAGLPGTVDALLGWFG